MVWISYQKKKVIDRKKMKNQKVIHRVINRLSTIDHEENIR